MPQRRINRREFLKLAIASAAAAGLSHFRVLNIGGANVVLAQTDDCMNDATGGSSDTCEPENNNPDTCPEPLLSDRDTCDDATDSVDYCLESANELDVCLPPWSPDVCDTEDTCLTPGQPGDVCEVDPVDDPDSCDPAGADPDVCESPGNDTCPDPAPGDGDICNPDAGEEDYCEPPGGPDTCEIDDPDQTPDTCDPGAGDPDSPNPVTVGSVGAESASSMLASLGGVAAALGAAALWLRHRLRPEKPEEPKTE